MCHENDAGIYKSEQVNKLLNKIMDKGAFKMLFKKVNK